MNPQSQHDGEAASANGWAYRVIYPREEHFTSLGNTLASPRFSNSVVHDPELATRVANFHKANERKTNPINAEFIWAEILYDLVDRHGEQGQSARYDSHDARRIFLVEEILRANFVEGISLSELAVQVGWSKWHLVRAFKRAKGVSPHGYILDCRLRHAKTLIRAGAPLAMASAASGFVDQSHMTRHFIGAYGLTPGSYQTILSS